MRGLAETQKKTKKQTASKAAAETCIHLADNYHTQLAKTSRRHSSAQNHTHLADNYHTQLAKTSRRHSDRKDSRRTQRRLVLLLEESFFIKSSYNFYL